LEDNVFKRTFDFVFAASLLVLSAPVLLVCAVLIKLESVGPVLFRQKRVGRNFRQFELYKLRTMTAGSKGLPYTVGGDPRVTRVGTWLRRTKLDEFPQLYNVLRGDMSIVGPRPVVPEIASDFREQYVRLVVVRPGLTDPASLKYCRESELLARVPDPIAYFESVVAPEKIRISQMYIEKCTAWSDLQLIYRTAFAVWDAAVHPTSNANTQPGSVAGNWQRPRTMGTAGSGELPPGFVVQNLSPQAAIALPNGPSAADD
jgi:lipopolysaccharide/colanic/teichoic acid biosynthesis glycosyltransferase